MGFIDLNGFKEINDSYGHDIGDLILVEVSKKFFASIRKQDIVARVGGDEFIIIFSICKIFGIENIVQKMEESFLNQLL